MRDAETERTMDRVNDMENADRKTIDPDEFEKRFMERYRTKKKVNAAVSFLIVFCGVSAIMYSVFVFHNNLFDRMRYMTFDGTIFTTIISFISGFTFLREARDDTEVTNRSVFFLRLSSAATEMIIFAVVMFGLAPLVPDVPDITSYTGIMMHLVIPFLMVFSFVFNDAPQGKLKPAELLKGSAFITIYAVIMLILFGGRILPSSLAPYSFLDFDNTSLGFKLACLAGIYLVAYIVSWLLVILNGRLSWIWFSDMNIMREMRKNHKIRG